MADGVVKVDADLLKEVEKFVEKDKLKFSSKKQFVNLAIVEYLKSQSLKQLGKKNGKKGR